MLHVAWSVCVCLAHGWAVQNGWTDGDAVWGLTHVGPGKWQDGKAVFCHITLVLIVFFWSLFFFLLLVASNRSSCIVLHPLLLLLYYIVSYCIVFNYIVLNLLSSWHSDRSMECVQLCFRYLNLTIKMRLQTKILMSIHSNQTLRNRWMTEYINRLSVGIFVFVA